MSTVSAVTWSRLPNPLAAANKAANQHELKSTESLVSTEMLNQISIHNINEQRIESEPDITLTASNKSTNLNDGMKVESITPIS